MGHRIGLSHLQQLFPSHVGVLAVIAECQRIPAVTSKLAGNQPRRTKTHERRIARNSAAEGACTVFARFTGRKRQRDQTKGAEHVTALRLQPSYPSTPGRT